MDASTRAQIQRGKRKSRINTSSGWINRTSTFLPAPRLAPPTGTLASQLLSCHSLPHIRRSVRQIQNLWQTNS